MVSFIFVICEASLDSSDERRISKLNEALLARVCTKLDEYRIQRVITGSGAVLTAQLLAVRLTGSADYLVIEGCEDLTDLLRACQGKGNVVLVVNSTLIDSLRDEVKLPLGLRVYDAETLRVASHQVHALMSCFKPKAKTTNIDRLQAMFASFSPLLPLSEDEANRLPAEDLDLVNAQDQETDQLIERLQRQIDEIDLELRSLVS
jgi:hypothetical protein